MNVKKLSVNESKSKSNTKTMVKNLKETVKNKDNWER